MNKIFIANRNAEAMATSGDRMWRNPTPTPQELSLIAQFLLELNRSVARSDVTEACGRVLGDITRSHNVMDHLKQRGALRPTGQTVRAGARHRGKSMLYTVHMEVFNRER